MDVMIALMEDLNVRGATAFVHLVQNADEFTAAVNNLENAGKLPFIFTVGCNPGEFNNYGECFCEAWLRATDDNGNPTGAVGHLGSTISQSWEPPMHGQWAMNAILTESYEGNVSRSYGGISVNGCLHMNEAQGGYGINETNHWTLLYLSLLCL